MGRETPSGATTNITTRPLPLTTPNHKRDRPSPSSPFPSSSLERKEESHLSATLGQRSLTEGATPVETPVETSLTTTTDDRASEKKRRMEEHHSTTTSSRFTEVKTYKPLSSGGFMDSGDGSPDRLRCMIVGAVVCVPSRLSPPSTHSHPSRSGSATPSPLASPVVRGSPTSTVFTDTAPNRYHAPPTSMSTARPSSSAAVAGGGGDPRHPSTPLSPSSSSSSSQPVRHAAEILASRFRGESSLGEEERMYGRRLDPQLCASLAEVRRVDTARRQMELEFLSGERGKFTVYEIRPAGFVEQRLYEQWKANPASRPVHTITSEKTCHTKVGNGAADAGKQPDGSLDGGASANSSSSTPTASPPVPWWVLPRLVVRIVAESAGPLWLGQKVVVQSIQRKESRMRLRRLDEVEGRGADSTTLLSRPQQQPQQQQQQQQQRMAGGRPPISTAESVVDVIGLESVETVVPRKGEKGMIVLGPRRGELVIVVDRTRHPKTGELDKVGVVPIANSGAVPTGTSEANDTATPNNNRFEVLPDEICALLQMK